jgi:uncharacterized protein (DUF924 family)
MLSIPRCTNAKALATQAARWALPAPVLARRDAVLDFWFQKGSWRPTEEAPRGKIENNFDLWYGGGEELDAKIAELFKDDVLKAVRGEYAAWAHEGPHSLLALIILLDQFPLNIFRDRPEGFAASELAIPLAYTAIARKWVERVDGPAQVFFTLPLTHSEHVEDQANNLAREPDDCCTVEHADIVFKYGRFPGRNAMHGRESSEEEKEYLKNGGVF